MNRLDSVRAALTANRDVGLDTEGVDMLLGLLADAVVLRAPAPPRAVSVTDSARELVRAECVQPGCPWENTDSCRFIGEHPHKMRRWALVGDVEDG